MQVGSPTLTEIRSRLCSASDNAPREQPSEPASCACPNVLSRYCGQETAARAGLASLVECPPHELKPTTALGAGRAQACQRQCPVPGRRRTAASGGRSDRGHLAVPPLPHHWAYGSRTTAVRRVMLGQEHEVEGDRGSRSSGCAGLVGPPGILTCARTRSVTPAAIAAWNLGTPRRRSSLKRLCPFCHCRQKYERNLRRIQASRLASTRGVWQKRK